MIATTRPGTVIPAPQVTDGAKVTWPKIGVGLVAVLLVYMIATQGTGKAFMEPIQESCHTRQSIGTCAQVGTPNQTSTNQQPATAQTPVGDVFNENPAAAAVPEVFNENPTGTDILPPTFEGQ